MAGLSPNMKTKKGRVLTGFVNTTPVVTITGGSAAVTAGAAEAGYTATALDTESGDIRGTLTWTSDLDGLLGNGDNATLTFTTVGSHVLTARAVDSAGDYDTDTLAVTVS